MKVIKLATALLIGCSAFNPLVALSQPLIENNQTTFFMDGKNYSCSKAERAGNYFKIGISGLCDRAGYKRQFDYGKEKYYVDPDVSNKIVAEGALSTINVCHLFNNISREIIVISPRLKSMCASVGILIKNKD